MAKARKSTRKREEDDDEDDDDVIEAEPYEKEEEEYDEAESSEKEVKSEPKKGLFQQFGEGLKAAGAAAGRYTKLGLTMAELEKLRYDLRNSYQRLGEAVTRCWDAAPDIGISSSDSDVKELVRKVNALRRQIREVEVKVRNLKAGGKPEAEKAKETKS